MISSEEEDQSDLSSDSKSSENEIDGKEKKLLW